MKSFKLVLFASVLCFSSGVSQHWSGDTLNINPITFDDPSPIGWNAQYNAIVQFPDKGEWSKILMLQTLKCDSATAGDKYPCGEWDYIWNTYIKVPQGDSLELFTLGSFVTPYGKRLKLGGDKGWQWVYDITEYAPLLVGERELVTGNNQELLNLEFLFIKGKPARNVLKVENIYPYGEYKYEHLANDSLLKETQIVLSPKAKGFMVKATISGHGHAGPFNCCEWDSKTHTYRYNGWETFRWNVWKDCGLNPIYPQGGTWPFDRAGWCPGTKVDEYEFELTPKVSPGDTILFDYEIEPYSNNGEKDGTFRMSHQLFSYSAPNYKNDAALVKIITPNRDQQYGRMSSGPGVPIIVIQNQGENLLKSLTVIYGIQGKRKQKFQWQGSLGFLEQAEIVLPAVSWKHMRSNGIFEAQIKLPKGIMDENKTNNIFKSQFDKHEALPKNFILSIKTNNIDRAKENSYFISDASGLVWYDKDDFTDSTSYRIPISLSKGQYQFVFKDKMEDGISRHWWYRNSAPELIGIDGRVQIETVFGDTLVTFRPDFGQELLFDFIVE